MISLRVDFAVTRTDGTAVRSHPRDRKEASIGERNPRDFRLWQLAEEHGLALERQAEEHHRSEAEQKRESRKLPSQVERRREWSKRRQRPWRLLQMSVAPQATS